MCDNYVNPSNNMLPNKVVLLACGSFNPPTNMHLRMFEIAKDHIHRMGTHQVIGGLMSPVHDSYAKAELAPSSHRLAMLKLSLQDNTWVKMSEWESRQETWTRTRQTLQYHQNELNAVLNNLDANCNENVDWVDSWMRNTYDTLSGETVLVKLLCGADLLESFGTPGLWSNEDIETIVGQHGLVVITRESSDPKKFIYNSDVLTKYMGNITIVTEWITNEVSSTKIRRALRRCESVRYLIPDKVIEYIETHGLYGCAKSNISKYLIPILTPNSLTPSPNGTHNSSDQSASPSPTNCMNLCNNNVFPSMPPRVITIDVPDVLARGKIASVVSRDAPAAVKSKPHPGQAVKIIAGLPEVTKSTHLLKNSKSCTELDCPDRPGKLIDVAGTAAGAISASKSSESLEQKSCDENLIKFILTKHGIQVISDVETIV